LDERSILVVDDEESILNAVERELYFWKAEKGINIYKANSADSAMSILQEHHDSIVVLISDLKMSRMSGDQLILETKKLYPHIRSILMTGYSEMGGVSKAVSAGITAFIPKPWDTGVFISEIEKAMNQFYEEAVNREYLDKLKTQLERTGQFQRRLFQPETFPQAKYDIEVTYQPLSEYRCGGDFYHVIPISDDRCVVMLGDVSGGGVEAAFVTGIVRTLITREEIEKTKEGVFSPARFLTSLNRLILKELKRAPELVITLTTAFLDCAAGKLVVSGAGNLPVYVIRSDRCESHSAPGCPPCFSPGSSFKDAAVEIRPGDLIAFMTDGLLDQGCRSGYINLTAAKVVFSHFMNEPDFNRRIVNFILELFPDRKFADDVTLITARIR